MCVCVAMCRPVLIAVVDAVPGNGTQRLAITVEHLRVEGVLHLEKQ